MDYIIFIYVQFKLWDLTYRLTKLHSYFFHNLNGDILELVFVLFGGKKSKHIIHVLISS